MRHPWSAWYWDDWDAHTAHLSHTQYSIYHRLLKHYYRTQKPLVANASDLARVCLAVGAAEEADLQSILKQFFISQSDGYHNKRADEEIARAISISNKRAKAGSKGGQKKSSKSQAIAKHLPPHSHTHIRTPLTPLAGGNLTTREYKTLSTEVQKIWTDNAGANWTDEYVLEKACQRKGIPFERARSMLGASA